MLNISDWKTIEIYMKLVQDNLLKLSDQSKQITLYRNFDVNNVLKGIGRVPGKFDNELLEFLKFTNGASIFDYCFLGFKNNRLGVNIDKLFLELWFTDNQLAGHMMPFMTTSLGDSFGYLLDLSDDYGRHPIVYYSGDGINELHVIGSSFEAFMTTFLQDVQETLTKSNGEMIILIEKDGWPINAEHWLSRDEQLRKLHNGGTLSKYFKENMPLTKWH